MCPSAGSVVVGRIRFVSEQPETKDLATGLRGKPTFRLDANGTAPDGFVYSTALPYNPFSATGIVGGGDNPVKRYLAYCQQER